MVHATIPEFDDLPRRNWRGWWLSWPKWFRIGCWATFGVVMLQVAVVLRISIGLIEPAAIRSLRRPGVHVIFASNRRTEPFRGFNRMMDGLKGISCSDVAAIRLDEHGTDAHLDLIGRSFPNLQDLYLAGSQVTSAGLEKLLPCQKLQWIDLSETDLDDAAAQQLTQFPNWTEIRLSGTLIGDRTLSVLQSNGRKNCTLDVSYTDVTLEGVETARAVGGKNLVRTELDRVTSGILGSIRWSDGSRSGQYAGSYELSVSGPIVDGHSTGRFAQMSSKLTRRTMWWDTQQFQGRTDGEYHFTAKLDGIESAPAIVKIQGGYPDVSRIEFRMPCTKAEALRSAKPDHDPSER
ncbi:MAG: hypothetical protein JSS49_16615 [Planctomycetes bacterium]|nr:hypothetical protein [Planctomycetota bacterium]